MAAVLVVPGRCLVQRVERVRAWKFSVTFMIIYASTYLSSRCTNDQCVDQMCLSLNAVTSADAARWRGHHKWRY